VLESYRPKKKKQVKYTIDDHSKLAKSIPMRKLFDAFRREVLALDPCVDEEILKHYIAFKAESNFVDVVPQKNQLLLSLNMFFHEIHDPLGMCKDVSNIGIWGNGEIELRLKSLEELPYVMGLVRQSLEKQLGNGDAEE